MKEKTKQDMETGSQRCWVMPYFMTVSMNLPACSSREVQPVASSSSQSDLDATSYAA
jgi:hypothetical protein